MKILLADLFYLPNVEFFSSIKDSNVIFIHLEDRYVKQSYRNRCEILLTNKVEKLSVPVHGGNKKVPYKDIKIDYDQKWLNVHLRGIQSGYGKAPFFEYLYPDLEAVFLKKYAFLWELNWGLLTICLDFLKMDVRLETVDKIRLVDAHLDLRGAFDVKSGDGRREFHMGRPYMQLFGLDFVTNLSIVDLLFCEGPEAKQVLALRTKKRN